MKWRKSKSAKFHVRYNPSRPLRALNKILYAKLPKSANSLLWIAKSAESLPYNFLRIYCRNICLHCHVVTHRYTCQETGDVRQETWDRKEKGDMRQTGKVRQTWDIRDVRQEKWDRRCETVRIRERVFMRQGTRDMRQGTEEVRRETRDKCIDLLA